MNAFEGFQEKVANVAALPKRGTPMQIGRPAEAVQYPITELFNRLLTADIKITKEINQALRAEYGETIDGAAMDAVIQQYSGGAALGPVQGLSLVVNR
jgi:hypothetical protein